MSLLLSSCAHHRPSRYCKRNPSKIVCVSPLFFLRNNCSISNRGFFLIFSLTPPLVASDGGPWGCSQKKEALRLLASFDILDTRFFPPSRRTAVPLQRFPSLCDKNHQLSAGSRYNFPPPPHTDLQFCRGNLSCSFFFGINCIPLELATFFRSLPLAEWRLPCFVHMETSFKK